MVKVNFIHLIYNASWRLGQAILWLTSNVSHNVSVLKMSHSVRALQERERRTSVARKDVYLFIEVFAVK